MKKLRALLAAVALISATATAATAAPVANFRNALNKGINNGAIETGWHYTYTTDKDTTTLPTTYNDFIVCNDGSYKNIGYYAGGITTYISGNNFSSVKLTQNADMRKYCSVMTYNNSQYMSLAGYTFQAGENGQASLTNSVFDHITKEEAGSWPLNKARSLDTEMTVNIYLKRNGSDNLELIKAYNESTMNGTFDTELGIVAEGDSVYVGFIAGVPSDKTAEKNAFFTTNFKVDVQSTPEPATMALLAAGGIALLRRRKNKA